MRANGFEKTGTRKCGTLSRIEKGKKFQKNEVLIYCQELVWPTRYVKEGGWMDGWMGEWMGGWVGGWWVVGGWVDGRMEGRQYIKETK